LRIVILGSAAGLPTPERNLSAVLMEVDGEQLLFDCGEGTQRQMIKARLSPCRRMKIFITHLHGDHLFGLPGLIQTMNLMNRSYPLEVYGPPGLKEFLNETTLSTMSEPVFDLSLHEASEGEVCRTRSYRVMGAWGDHSTPNMAYKVIFGESAGKFSAKKAAKLGIPEGPLRSELKAGRPVMLGDGRKVYPAEVLGKPLKGRSVVYTGDTKPTPGIIRLAEGSDLLIHEATFSSELAERAAEEGHSTAEGAARVAKEANVKRLLLTHLSARYPDPKVLEEEAKKIFNDVEVTEDFKVYELKK